MRCISCCLPIPQPRPDSLGGTVLHARDATLAKTGSDGRTIQSPRSSRCRSTFFLSPAQPRRNSTRSDRTLGLQYSSASRVCPRASRKIAVPNRGDCARGLPRLSAAPTDPSHTAGRTGVLRRNIQRDRPHGSNGHFIKKDPERQTARINVIRLGPDFHLRAAELL